MNSIERARVIQHHMGGEIYWDTAYRCYRVLNAHSQSLYRYHDTLDKVEGYK